LALAFIPDYILWEHTDSSKTESSKLWKTDSSKNKCRKINTELYWAVGTDWHIHPLIKITIDFSTVQLQYASNSSRKRSCTFFWTSLMSLQNIAEAFPPCSRRQSQILQVIGISTNALIASSRLKLRLKDLPNNESKSRAA